MTATPAAKPWTSDDVRDFLRKVADVAGRYARRPGFAFTGPEDFVLRHGLAYTPRPLPAGIRLGAARRCFQNAWEAARRHGLVYVEGFAVAACLPVLHAWAAERGGTEVVEVTWPTPGEAYVGVPFAAAFTGPRLAADGCLLDAWKAGWPLLREGLPEAAWRYAGPAGAAT